MRLALLLAATLAAAPAAFAQAPGGPIPEEPDSTPPPEFIGSPATPKPLTAPIPPRHPFMAPNENSNIHDDAYMSDFYSRSGPLGRDTETLSTFQSSDCASVTFDSRGRIVTICVGLEGPRLMLLDPRTLDELGRMQLPPRIPSADGSIFNDFAGGGYFYLDHRDRAVLPTTTRHVWVVRVEPEGRLVLERDHDLTGVVPPGDKIISALPDWSGRIWFASIRGVVGSVDPATGAIRAKDLGEDIANSFAVDDSGAVYVVTERALYRLDPAADGTPVVTWRERYENSGISKPGQVHAGSGTTPTVMSRGRVAIADNADPMNVVVYRRGRHVSGPRFVCRQPVFRKGASATDQSLIVAGGSIVVENNYGYTGPRDTMDGRSTAPGIERVDVRTGGRCRRMWQSREVAPSVVPKLSLETGLVYTYTKPPRRDGTDAWYFTALDFCTGKTVYKRLAGTGFGYNNNYAPVTLGPDGSAYVGALGGLVLLRDRPRPSGPPASAPRGCNPRLRLTLRLRYRRGRTRGGRRCARGPVRATVTGADSDLVRRADFYRGRRRVARDRRAPFSRVVDRHRPRRRSHGHVAGARLRLVDGRLVRLARRYRVCAARRRAAPRFTG